MAEPLFVSLIILNWNGKDYIGSCLRSILDSTYKNYEVIVVDNASTDGSIEIVKKEFPEVMIICNQRNIGFAAGNNVGIKHSKGDIIGLVNSDVIVDRDWLSELIKEISASSKIGVVSGVILYKNHDNLVESIGVNIDSLTGTHWRVGQYETLSEMTLISDIDSFMACALLIKKVVIEDVGLLDERFFLYFEDADWIIRAREAGYEIKLVPSAVVWHEGSASSMKIPLKKYYHYSYSSFRFYFKHYPLSRILTSIFFQLFITPVIEILIFKRPVIYIWLKVKAFARNIKMLKSIIAQRKEIHKKRKHQFKNRIKELFISSRKHFVLNEYNL